MFQLRVTIFKNSAIFASNISIVDNDTVQQKKIQGDSKNFQISVLEEKQNIKFDQTLNMTT